MPKIKVESLIRIFTNLGFLDAHPSQILTCPQFVRRHFVVAKISATLDTTQMLFPGSLLVWKG